MKFVKLLRYFVGSALCLFMFDSAKGHPLINGTLLANQSFEQSSTGALSGFSLVQATTNQLAQPSTIIIPSAALASTQGLASLSVAYSGGKITIKGDNVWVPAPIDFSAKWLQNDAPIGSSDSNLYISFLFRSVSQTHASGYSGLCFADHNGVNGLLIGNSWSSQTTSIVDTSTHANTDLRNFGQAGEFNIADDDTHLVVVRMSRIPGKTIFTTWLDPAPATGESNQNSPTTFMGTMACNHAFERIFLYGGTNNSMDFDEIRLGTSWTTVLPPTDPTHLFPQHDFEVWHTFFEKHLGNVKGYSFLASYHGTNVASGNKGNVWFPEKDAKGIPWTTQEKMHVASVSKAITATAIMKLLEEKAGQVSLDEPFWPYLKNIFPNASTDSKQITIRQLLTHRSGLTDDAADTRSAAKLLATFTKHPASGGFYNNLNFYILRLLIEQLSGEAYVPYVQNHVLIPAGITSMDTKSAQTGWDATAFAGAIGWHASVTDITTYLYALSQGKIITKQSAEIMYHESLGWDPIQLGSQTIGYRKSGSWLTKKGQGETSEIVHFIDGTDVALLINSHVPTKLPLIVAAWKLDKSGELPRITHYAGF